MTLLRAGATMSICSSARGLDAEVRQQLRQTGSDLRLVRRAERLERGDDRGRLRQAHEAGRVGDVVDLAGERVIRRRLRTAAEDVADRLIDLVLADVAVLAGAAGAALGHIAVADGDLGHPHEIGRRHATELATVADARRRRPRHRRPATSSQASAQCHMRALRRRPSLGASPAAVRAACGASAPRTPWCASSRRQDAIAGDICFLCRQHSAPNLDIPSKYSRFLGNRRTATPKGGPRHPWVAGPGRSVRRGRVPRRMGRSNGRQEFWWRTEHALPTCRLPGQVATE